MSSSRKFNMLLKVSVTTEGHEFEPLILTTPYLLYSWKDSHKNLSKLLPQWVDLPNSAQGQGDKDHKFEPLISCQLRISFTNDGFVFLH